MAAASDTGDLTIDPSPPAAPPTEMFSKRYRGWLLFLLILVYAANIMDRGIVGLLGQAIKVDLQLSDTQLGLLGGFAFSLFYTVAGIPLARLADRTNRIHIVSFCLVIWSAMTAICGLATSYVQLFLSRIVVGIGEAGCSPAAYSLLSDHYPPQRRTSAFAIFGLGVPIGGTLGAILGGWTAEAYGWRAAFLVVGAPGILLALLVKFTLREPERGRFDPPTSARPAPLKAVIKTLAGKPAFWHLVAGSTLVGFVTYGISMFTPIFLLRQYHLNYAQLGLLQGLMFGVATAIGTLGGGLLADRAAVTDKRWYVWVPAASMTTAIPLFITAFLQTNWIVGVLLLTVSLVFSFAFLSPTIGVSQNMVPARMRASTFALLMIGSNLVGAGGGPLFMGLLSDRFGRHTFGAANYVEICKLAGEADTLSAAMKASCAEASRAGVQFALIALTLFYLWAVAHYLLAGRSLRRDLAEQTSLSATSK